MMKTNEYFGMGYVELEEMEIEYLMLYKDAQSRGDYIKANEYENELRLIRDVMAAYERGVQS